MASERENQLSNNGYGTLKLRRYDIAGNEIRAFYDSDNRLVFVIDDTITSAKPNALLVIGPVGNRKWDDILANDYGVVLESIRPKKDNKYQKLDIEYAGLSAYDNLIQRFGESDDLDSELAALAEFRMGASRNAATERLAMADTLAENARATIDKTQDVIDELNARMRTLRSKLTKQRKDVGREPTKQSAAKILRTESQIDATREKLARANKRLANARRRLAAADADADVAREILAQYDGRNAGGALVKTNSNKSMPAVMKSNPVARLDDFDDEADDMDDDAPVTQKMIERDAAPIEIPVFTSYETDNNNQEPKADNMADEEVKPLFDKDPEILDEEIAFKPIDFNVPAESAPTGVAPRQMDVYSDVSVSRSDVAPAPQMAPSPLSFTPPSAPAYDGNVSANSTDVGYAAPVLDGLTPAPAPQPAPAPFDYTAADNNVAAPAPADFGVAPAQPAAAASAARPASPLGATPVSPVAGAADSNGGRRPNVLYYIMLAALIILSIFTLWMYQRGNNTAVPDLAAVGTTKTDTAPAQPALSAPAADENPFIITEETTITEEITPAPEQVAAPVAEPEPVETAPIQEPEPIEPVIDMSAPSVPVPVEEPDPIPDESEPFLTEPVPDAEPVTIVPPVVNKAAYSAGPQQEKMFVADETYESDIVAPDPYAVEETVAQTEDEEMCSDGSPADMYGCCSGEEYVSEDNVCCPVSGGDCFPPMR